MTGPIGVDPVCAITLDQPWASLTALGIKTVETRSWPAPERPIGQVIAVHAGRWVVRRPGDRIERVLQDRLKVKPAIFGQVCDVMQSTN